MATSWDEVERVVESIYGPVDRPDESRVTDAIIRAQTRLGFPLPRVLRHWYVRYGWEYPIHNAHDRILPPDDLELRGGLLTFCRENQDVLDWAVPVPDPPADDPPVMVTEADGEPAWEPFDESLSGYFVAFAYWQAVNGALGVVGVVDEAPAATMAKVEQNWPAIPLSGNKSGIRLFGGGGQWICFPGGRAVHAAAKTFELLLDIEERTGIMWDYSEPE